MARRCSVCTSPHRADVDRALVAGEALRDIAGRFALSRSACERHKNDHLPEVLAAAETARSISTGDEAGHEAGHTTAKRDTLPDHAPALALQVQAQHDAELAHAYTLDELRRIYSAIAVKTALACDLELTDPRDPSKYTLAPRAHEIEVVYWQTVGERQVRQVAGLDALLTRLDVEAGVQVDRTRVKVADTRELVLKAAGELRSQAQLMVGVLEKHYTIQKMERFQQIVLEALEEAAPDVRAAVDRAMGRRQHLFGLPPEDSGPDERGR